MPREKEGLPKWIEKSNLEVSNPLDNVSLIVQNLLNESLLAASRYAIDVPSNIEGVSNSIFYHLFK